jgi:hypothetical protein
VCVLDTLTVSCISINDASLRALVDHCTWLRFVTVSYCDNVTNEVWKESVEVVVVVGVVVVVVVG